MKYDYSKLEEAVKNSLSMRGVLKELGAPWSGGLQNWIALKVKRLNLDTSHFKGKAANCGPNHKGGPNKRSDEDLLALLVQRPVDSGRSRSTDLRKAFKLTQVEYSCAICHNEGKWLGKDLVLDLDHKNSINTDDRKENLQWLCPNCHSQKSR